MIGGLLATRLDASTLVAIGRRANPALDGVVRQVVAPPEDWPKHAEAAQADVAISTLGTTIRVAGSQAAFAAIDRDAVIAFARGARAGGARQFLIVSSVGANPNASNFYLKTKGEAEEGVRALGFDRVDIFRPGLLRGARAGSSRPVESIMIAISPITDMLTPRAFDRYRSVSASDVAAAMIAVLGREEPGVHVHENRAIGALAGK